MRLRKKKLNTVNPELHSGAPEYTIQRPEGSVMVRYLIRRQNRYGNWGHIDTVEVGPRWGETWESYVGRRFGPGRYSIVVAQEGVPGLRALEGESIISVGWEHDYLGWWNHKPTWEELVERYQGGDFIIAQLTNIEPLGHKRDNADSDTIDDILQQGASAFRGGYVVFRLKGLPQ